MADKKDFTPEELKGWKAKYGENKIRQVDIQKEEDSSDVLSVVCRVPDRKVMGEFEKWMDKDPNKSKEIIIKACVLTHKEEILENDFLFAGAFQACVKLIPVATVSIKNL